MEIEEIVDALKKIKSDGYVVSLRKGPTGIGKTLETLFGIEENNFKIPDFGTIELKSQRRNVSNRVTMFTFNRGVWLLNQKEVIKKYGYVDTDNREALYCTVNSRINQQGFYLDVYDESLLLKHKDGTSIASWEISDLVNAFSSKMPSLIVVYADSRFNAKGKEEFWFNEAYLLKNPDIDNFIDLLKKDIVIVDIRMHLKKVGTVRNHGTAFRILENHIRFCFGIKEKLI